MIARLRGPIVYKGEDHAILDVGGVGYEVFVPAVTMDELPLDGDPVTLLVHTHVREDAIQLFGFAHPGDRTLFLKLLGVTGIGPRLALQALGTWGGTALRDMIVQGDEKGLTRTPGIGKRMAQRLVLELGDKVAGVDTGGAAAPSAARSAAGGGDILEDLALALAGLGFAPRQIDDVCAKLREQAAGGEKLQALLKEALRLLRS